jgi:hypothetical protein
MQLAAGMLPDKDRANAVPRGFAANRRTLAVATAAIAASSARDTSFIVGEATKFPKECPLSRNWSRFGSAWGRIWGTTMNPIWASGKVDQWIGGDFPSFWFARSPHSSPGAMAAAAPPVNVRQVFNLPSLGIAASNISIKSTTMVSDKAICVREPKPDGTGSTAIVDTATGRISSRKPLNAEAAVLSPDGRTIAVRGKILANVLQIILLRQTHLPVPNQCFWPHLTGFDLFKGAYSIVFRLRHVLVRPSWQSSPRLRAKPWLSSP